MLATSRSTVIGDMSDAYFFCRGVRKSGLPRGDDYCSEYTRGGIGGWLGWRCKSRILGNSYIWGVFAMISEVWNCAL